MDIRGILNRNTYLVMPSIINVMKKLVDGIDATAFGQKPFSQQTFGTKNFDSYLAHIHLAVTHLAKKPLADRHLAYQI